MRIIYTKASESFNSNYFILYSKLNIYVICKAEMPLPLRRKKRNSLQ